MSRQFYEFNVTSREHRFRPNVSQVLDCYVIADFAGLWKVENESDPVCVKSRTGYVLLLGGCPLTSASRLQTEIALSTVLWDT